MTIGKLIARPLAKGVSEIAQPLIHTGTEAAEKAVIQTVKQSSKVFSEPSQKLLNKISAYFRRIPADSKVTNPIKINLEGCNAGFTMDKTLSGGRTKVVLKDMLEEGKDFSARVPRQSSLQLIFDKNGQLVNGDLCTHLGFGITDHVAFERAGKNIRRMTYGGTSYMPVGGDAHWVPVAQTQSTHASMRDVRGYLWSDAGRNNNLADALERSPFGELLMHLAELKTSL